MPKRDPENEAAESEPAPEVPPTVGERLRAAREEKKLTLEDVAAQTRIPQRHLASIETAEWDSLPAPTYTIGFAKNYAGIVGLDRTEIGDQLREEMGGQRFATTSADVFEPADPRRTMPKSLVIGAVIAAVLLIASDELPQSPLARPAGAQRRCCDERRGSEPLPQRHRAAGPCGFRSGGPDRDRPRVDPGHRSGHDAVPGRAPAGADLHRARERRKRRCSRPASPKP